MKLADWFRAKKQEWFGRKEEQPAEVSAEASEKAKPAKKKSSSRKKTAETAVQPEKPQETETVEKAQETEPAEKPQEKPEDRTESYSGILIDEDCSDFEAPEDHDLPCMLMYSCRDSGYGLDILQEDGTYKFYMFDSAGQELAWEYLNKTTRMCGLYVTVTGIYEDGVIKVKTLRES